MYRLTDNPFFQIWIEWLTLNEIMSEIFWRQYNEQFN
jgi:hypothetical protein